MAKYFAKPTGVKLDSREWLKVSIIMWWPGRDKSDYDSATGGYDDLPEKFKSLVRRSIGSGSRYLVYASFRLPTGEEVYGYSRCMDIDNPRTQYGIDKAVGFLRKHLWDKGWLFAHRVPLEPGEYKIVRVEE